MKKKTMKAGALGLVLAMGIATVGGVTPTRSVAAAETVAEVEETSEKASWMIDGDWIAAEDTTVTDEVRKMVMDTLMHAVGSARVPIAYLGYQKAEGTNHCVLCRTNPVVPNPTYSFLLMYVHEDPSGAYSIYQTRRLEVSEYAAYPQIRCVKLNKAALKLKKGKKKTVKATFYPATEEAVTYTWKSLNKKVATVKNGVITAKKKGTCYIVCRVKGEDDVCDICRVTVR